MSNIVILNLQYVMAFGTYIMLHLRYLRPWFAAQSFGAAVLPLLLLHAFRYLGLTLLVPGQMDPAIPFGALQIMAWGDFASGVAALLAALAVHRRWSCSTALVGAFTLVGVGDFILVGYHATQARVFFADMGTMWFVNVIYAPALLLSQGYIAHLLLRHLRRPSA